MRVLIFGGDGFIGRNLHGEFDKRGFDVVSVVRVSEVKGFTQRSDCTQLPISSQNFLEDAINLIRRLKPELVINAIGVWKFENNFQSKLNMHEANVLIPIFLAEACSEIGGLFVQLSTYWQFPSKLLWTEKNAYSFGKIATDAYLDAQHRYANLRIKNIVLFDNYGPDDSRSKITNIIVSNSILGKTLNISNPNRNLNLLFIEDVVSGIYHAIFCNSGERIMEVSSKRLTRLWELVSVIERVGKRRIEVEWTNNSKFEKGNLLHERLFSVPNDWEEQVQLNDGIERIFNIT